MGCRHVIAFLGGGLLCAAAAAQIPVAPLDTLLARELEKAGVPARDPAAGAPQSVRAPAAAERWEKPRTALALKGGVPAAVEATASGVLVRFSDPAIRRLADGNAAPPEAAISALQRASSQPLRYHRAMSGGMHVFRFPQPIGLQEAGVVMAALSRAPGVELVEPDVALPPQQSSSADPLLPRQWNVQGRAQGYPGGTDALATWPVTFGTGHPVVAIVDTGVLPHPEFASRILPGYDMVSIPVLANDGSGRDADAGDPGDWSAIAECGRSSRATASTWHGTHLAGIVAADGSNGIDMAGMSWRTRILPVRAVGKCGGDVSDILDAIQWSAGLPVPGVPDNPNPAHVINLSLGSTTPLACTRAYQEAINRAIGQGALVVVAAGNSGNDAALFMPANCKGVLVVVATDHLGLLASYSNVNSGAAISAPGGDTSFYGPGFGILSTVGIGARGPEGAGIAERQGTSMAAPHVAGAAALALSANPNLSGAELSFLLRQTAAAFPHGSFCAITALCGSGMVNAFGAVSGAGLLKDRSLVYEFYNSAADHYFRSASRGEAAGINRGSAGPGWFDTGSYFYAWSTQAPGTVPVCRFYSPGANSHFYTANAGECEAVKRNADWNFEGIAFYAMLPSGDTCAGGTTPVYRVYNNRHGFNDQNHRFTTDLTLYQQMIASGWLGEGVRLCV